MSLLDKWKKRRVAAAEVRSAALQDGLAQIQRQAAAIEQNIAQTHSHDLHALHREALLTSVANCGGVNDAQSAIRKKDMIISVANIHVRPNPFDRNPSAPQFQAIKDAYQYVQSMYLQRRLQQIHDTISAADFETEANLDARIDKDNQEFDTSLASLAHQYSLKLNFKSSAPTRTSFAETTATRYKSDCRILIDAIQRHIDKQYPALKGKTALELGIVNLDESLIAFALNDTLSGGISDTPEARPQ